MSISETFRDWLLKPVSDMLAEIIAKEKIIMATEQDLKAAIQGIADANSEEATTLAALATNVDKIIAKLSAGNTVDQADIDALTAATGTIKTSSASIQAASDKLAAAAQ